MKFASLCVLSYCRLESLRRSLESLIQFAEYPFELIIHDDGGDVRVLDYLLYLRRESRISYLILNAGRNMGVGHAFNACVNLAHGDYIFKLDQDLLYKPGWLKKSIQILDIPEVGAMGLFHYAHDPVDSRKMLINSYPDFQDHQDFVGSAVGFRRDVMSTFGRWDNFSDAFAEDYVWKMKVKEGGLKLALPHQDLAENFGFGYGPSTVVAKNEAGELVPSKFSKEPLIFNVETSTEN